MTTRRNIDRVGLREELRKRFPNGPRELLRKLGVDERVLALDGANTMKTSRLQYLALMRTAAALNPLLAMDAKVDYRPLFKGVTTKNLKAKSKQIVADAAKMLKGKTIAKDAPMEHFAQLLRHLEAAPEAANLDESVSPEQHKAMEAAAHGSSNLGIPKDVGQEFERADKGKSFDEMLMDWVNGRDSSKEFGEDDVEALKKMHADSMPENALDESEEEAEDEDDKDKDAEDEEAEDEDDKDGEDAARDRSAKDRRGGAHDSRRRKPAGQDRRQPAMLTQDDMNKAIAAERKNSTACAEAREFVRPYVGAVSIALDSAEKIHRAAAEAMAADGRLEIEDAELQGMNSASLKVLIRQAGKMAQDAEDRITQDSHVAEDEGGDGFDKRWGSAANRIGHA